MVNTYTSYDTGSMTASTLVGQLVGTPTGFSVVGSSIVYSGAASATSLYDGIDIGEADLSAGVLLTSGDGTPGTSNTSNSYSTGLDGAGDSDLSATLGTAFFGNTNTYDAASLSFTITVTDPGKTSIGFDVAFGSDEFPEYADSYPDIGAVYVNGVNYAYFSGDAARPLSVLSQNLDAFQDNTAGTLATEYDGISRTLTILAPVHLGENTIKIAIADTGDGIYDSGLFISNLHGSTLGSSGVKVIVNAGAAIDQDNDLSGGALDEYFDCGLGDDQATAGAGDDVLDMGGGNDDAFGEDGDDEILGDSGSDFICGGLGADDCSGGAGADIFDYNSLLDSGLGADNWDTILDFDTILDHIDLSGIDANTKKAGDQSFKFIGFKDFKGKFGQLHVVIGDDGIILEGDVNKDGVADFQIEITGLTGMAKDDFIL